MAYAARCFDSGGENDNGRSATCLNQQTRAREREGARAPTTRDQSRRAVTHQVLLPVDVARSSPADVARINLRRVVRDDCGTDRGRDVDVSREEGGRGSNRVAEGGRIFSPRRARRRGTRCRDASPVRVARFEYQSSNPRGLTSRGRRGRGERVTRGARLRRALRAKAFSRGKRKVQLLAHTGREREGGGAYPPMEPGRRADLPAPVRRLHRG